MTASPPQPVAEGTLARTPLAHVLVNITRRQMSGTLAVWPDPGPGGEAPRGQDRIRFAYGVAVAVRPISPVSEIDQALAALFAREEAPYAFFEADLVGSDAGVLEGRVDPYALVAEVLRGTETPPFIDPVLERLGSAALQLRSDAPLARFGFDPQEQRVVQRLRQPATAPQVLGEWPDRAVARRVLYLLAITRSIDAAASPPAEHETARVSAVAPAGQGPRSATREPHRSMRPSRPAPQSQPPPQAPDHLPAELGARWTRIVERVREIEDQNYFEMLGVERSGGPDAVRNAYFEQVKQWHPDRLPTELLPLKPYVDRVFHLVTEARDTLADPERRGEYVKAVQSGGGTPSSDRRVSNIVGAAVQFQKAEVFAKRKSWDEAFELLAEALELHSDEADFHAMHAWLLFQKHGVDEGAPIAQMVHSVDHALHLDATCVRAHYTKGVILKRLGKQREALRHFEKVTELDPRHIEAAREVRLAQMRSRTSAPPEAGAGRPSLLSKLFGDKKK